MGVSDLIHKLAYTMGALVDVSTPNVRSRVGKCGSHLLGWNVKTGRAVFSTHCAGSTGNWGQVVRFVDWINLAALLQDVGEDVEPLDLSDFNSVIKLIQSKGLDPDVVVNCNCPSFSYDEYAYLAEQGGYVESDEVVGGGYLSTESFAPSNLRNPGHEGALCKHLVSVAAHYNYA